MGTSIAFLGQPVLTWLPGDNKVRSAVIFLHGSGDTGPGVAEWVEARASDEGLRRFHNHGEAGEVPY